MRWCVSVAYLKGKEGVSIDWGQRSCRQSIWLFEKWYHQTLVFPKQRTQLSCFSVENDEGWVKVKTLTWHKREGEKDCEREDEWRTLRNEKGEVLQGGVNMSLLNSFILGLALPPYERVEPPLSSSKITKSKVSLHFLLKLLCRCWTERILELFYIWLTQRDKFTRISKTTEESKEGKKTKALP